MVCRILGMMQDFLCGLKDVGPNAGFPLWLEGCWAWWKVSFGFEGCWPDAGFPLCLEKFCACCRVSFVAWRTLGLMQGFLRGWKEAGHDAEFSLRFQGCWAWCRVSFLQHDVERKPQGVILLSETCRVSRAEGSNTFEICVGDRSKSIFFLHKR